MSRDEAIKVLGLNRNYKMEDVKSAYKKLAKRYHPDIAGAQYNDMFSKINEAYSVLESMGEIPACELTHSSIFKVARS